MSTNVLRRLALSKMHLQRIDNLSCQSLHHGSERFFHRGHGALPQETWHPQAVLRHTASSSGKESSRCRTKHICRAEQLQEGSEAVSAERPGIPTEGTAAEYCVVQSADTPGITQRCTIRDVPGAEADLLADTLLSLGAQSASVTEHRPHGKEEQEIFDEQQGTREVWDRCVVTAYFAPDLNVSGAIQIAKSALQLDDLQEEITQLADSDWADGICASYQPTCITEKLWIIPSWFDPQDNDAINVRVEPGLAFGTGEHPTSRLCLRELSHMGDLSGKHIVDYGTGSGVLALTALRLGASLAVGTDTDALAVRAASQNGVLNKFGGKWITLQCGPSIEDPDPLQTNPQGFLLPTEFDICIANILKKPLLELGPRLSQYVKPGGQILLSGILMTQVKEIQQAYEKDFEGFEVRKEEVWALIKAYKKR